MGRKRGRTRDIEEVLGVISDNYSQVGDWEEGRQGHLATGK